MPRSGLHVPGRKVWSVLAGLLVSVLLVIGLMLWLSGAFADKVDASMRQAAPQRPIADAALATAELVTVPALESAVGTIRPVRESAVASRILARVVAARITAGQQVKADQVLVELDDTALKARLAQAQAAVQAAEARRDQARIDARRYEQLFADNAAKQIERDKAVLALRTTEAEVVRLKQAVIEGEAVLSYATIRSPMDGVVVDKHVSSGDTVTPGQVLLKLYDATRMQLIAPVRESLAQQLKVGQMIGVRIDVLPEPCEGAISEIVPEAESASRAFQVKVTGPCPPGVYPGMFGRLLIPLGDEQLLLIPQSSVRRVGQLDVVDIADTAAGVLHRRAVQLGRVLDGRVEVLSGVKPGEQVAVPRAGSGDDA